MFSYVQKWIIGLEFRDVERGAGASELASKQGWRVREKSWRWS